MKKNYVLVAAGLGLAQLALQVNAGHAQSAKKADTVKTLNEVVVTATRSPKKLADIGRVVTIIGASELAASQGKTLPQVLNNVAGITFSGAQNNIGISSSLYVRGASVGNTLILVDGFPVNNASSIDGAYDLNAFPVDQIERIEILKGSGSTLYGSDAVAGVINIITKHAKTNGLTADVALSGGSYKTFKESVGLSGRIGKTGIALNLSNTDAGGFPAATDTTGKLNFKNDGYHQRSLSLNLDQPVTDKFSLNGNFQTSYNYGDLPSGAFTDDAGYTYHNTFVYAGIGGKLKLPEGSLLFNVAQNSVWNRYLDLASPANFNTEYRSGTVGHITNGEVVYTDNLASFLDITSGADVKYTSTIQHSTYSDINPGVAENNISSVYTSLFFKSDMAHLELGGRYNHHSKYGENLTYTVNPSIIAADELKLFATVASAYKAPSLYQLNSQYGNIDLKPEKTTSYEFGFDWSITNALSFNTVFYERKTTDVIYFFTNPSTFKSNYANGNLEDDKGFESELKYNKDGLTVSGYAAYVTGTQTDTKGNDTHNLLRRPRNTYGIDATYQVIKALSVGVNYKYTGERSDTHFLNSPPYSRVEGLAAYSLVDLHIQANANRKLSVFVDLDNLFDQKYIDWIGYNTRGFNAYGGLKYRL